MGVKAQYVVWQWNNEWKSITPITTGIKLYYKFMFFEYSLYLEWFKYTYGVT